MEQSIDTKLQKLAPKVNTYRISKKLEEILRLYKTEKRTPCNEILQGVCIIISLLIFPLISKNLYEKSTLNGAVLDEPYAQQLAMGECDLEFPFQVPQEQYFVMGDMRESSIDSRNTLIGCVEKDHMVGRVFFRIWPFKAIGVF